MKNADHAQDLITRFSQSMRCRNRRVEEPYIAFDGQGRLLISLDLATFKTIVDVLEWE